MMERGSRGGSGGGEKRWEWTYTFRVEVEVVYGRDIVGVGRWSNGKDVRFVSLYT